MINNLTSAKTVIAKIIADLGLDENNIKITDIKEWIFEALSKIGSVTLLNHKVAIIPIKDYQAKLPCELEKLDYVTYSCGCENGWLPMKKATSAFGVNVKIDNCCNTPTNEDDLICVVKRTFNCTDNYQAKCKLDSDAALKASIQNIITRYTGVVDDTHRINLEYMLKPGYIITTIKDGYLKISYYAQYVDEEGLPMIPDIASYHEAIYWYVAMKLLYIDYFSGRKPLHIYYDAKRSWNFYRQQAYAEGMMPDSGDVENIKNTWHTLVPERDDYSTAFKHLGDEQIIYNWN